MISSIKIASFWSFLSEIVSKTTSPLIFLIMTILLSPKDFGIVAVATSFLGFIYVVSDMGMSKVLIQSTGNESFLNKVYNVAFWFNIIIASILFGIVYIYSDKIAAMMGNIKAGIIIKVMSIQIITTALTSVQIAIKQKKLNFKILFYLRIVTTFTPAIVSIPLAFCGFGFWALVWGTVIGSILSSILLWYMSEWKPLINFDMAVFKKIFPNGLWSTLSSLSLWIPVLMDSFLITKYISLESLGLYTTSRNIHALAISIFLSPIMPVMYSSLVKVKDNIIDLKKMMYTFEYKIFFISMTMGISIYFNNNIIEHLFFNIKWNGIGNVLGIIFLIFGIEYFSTAATESLRSIGKFRIIAINTFLSSVITAVALFAVVKYGLITYVVVRCLLLFLQYPIVFLSLKQNTKITISDYFKNLIPIFKISLILVLINLLLKYLFLLQHKYDIIILFLNLALMLFYWNKEFHLFKICKRIVKARI